MIIPKIETDEFTGLTSLRRREYLASLSFLTFRGMRIHFSLRCCSLLKACQILCQILGGDFLRSGNSLILGSLQDLFITVRYMSGYSRLVFNHSEGIKLQSTGTLTDLRNSIQHRLLSLPACPSAQGSNGVYHLYESTRLGAQIYSLLCIYPYPAGPAPFVEAASRLKRELSSLDPRTISYEESKLLLWILVMGAIVTVGTFDRPWFIHILGSVAYRLQVESWPDMKSLLLTFLWLSKTNDIDGRDVWDEVSSSIFEHSRPVRFSSATPSVASSLDMSIRTRSISSAEIEENPGDQPFSTPS